MRANGISKSAPICAASQQEILILKKVKIGKKKRKK
jgi:hypothetical protein